MDIEIHAERLDDETRRAFRRAAEARGAEAVVEWEGRPHLVRARRGEGEEEIFVLEPIPRPFG